MYCEYGGLKYKIKKKNNKYIITSRVRKEGFTNYIDVLGNKHSELYMKIVKANEVDIIYNEDVFIKYKDKYFQLFADKVSRNCIFRKNRALAPHERSAVPLGTDHCPVC